MPQIMLSFSFEKGAKLSFCDCHIFLTFNMLKVGDRCEVEPEDKRGVVKFVCLAESLAPGFWVGVQYDEPLGKHDGM
jgi:hypothetical protein